jgi:hypothetical protein
MEKETVWGQNSNVFFWGQRPLVPLLLLVLFLSIFLSLGVPRYGNTRSLNCFVYINTSVKISHLGMKRHTRPTQVQTCSDILTSGLHGEKELEVENVNKYRIISLLHYLFHNLSSLKNSQINKWTFRWNVKIGGVTSVARWYIFNQKSKFGQILEGLTMEYIGIFIAILSMVWPNGIL